MTAHGNKKRRTLPRGVEQLPSGLYRGRVYRDGTRYSTDSAYTTVREAQDALASLRTDLARGDWIASRGGLTVAEYFDRWNPSREVRPATITRDKSRFEMHIKPYLGNRSLNAVTPDVLATWMSDLARKGLSIGLRRQCWAVLSSMLGKKGALRSGLIRANPCAAVAAPRPQQRGFRVLSAEEFELLLGTVREDCRVMLLLAAYTGVRWSEMVGLRVGDWNVQRSLLTIERPLTENAGRFSDEGTKSRRKRVLPVHPRLTEALTEHLAGRAPLKRSDPLVTMPSGGLLRHSNFRRDVWLPTLEACGIDARWHDLRHTHATWLVEHGVDLVTVQELLGHSQITTTRIYAHTASERLRDAVLRLPE